ncbi:MAG: biotin/lipoyl-binding protein [Tepidisphaeraceae bacterium]
MEAGAQTVAFHANPENAVWLGIAFVVLKFIHELGHGFMCRRFGGECHELGVMFLVLFPAPYVDASSAWSFPNKYHRVLVGAGGMIFELAVAAVAAWVWVTTEGNNAAAWINTMAYNVLLISSVSTVLFNANPLLRYDGYYILSDLLEMPNLQYRSREYSLYLIKRYLFRVKWSQPIPHGFRTKAWLLFYNYTSAPYRTLVSIGIMIFVLYQLPEELKILGLILFLGSVASFAIVPLFKTVKYLSLDPELHRKRLLAWSWTLGFVTVLVLLLGVAHFHLPFFDVRGEAVLLASAREPVFPKVEGKVVEVRVSDGQHVKKGDTILVLENKELDSQLAQAKARRRQLDIDMRAAEVDFPDQAKALQREIEGVDAKLAEVKQQQDWLTVRAATDGVVVGPDLVSLLGRHVSAQGAGQDKPYAEVIDDKQVVAYTMIEDKDYQLVREAVRAEAKDQSKQAFTSQVRLASDPTSSVDQSRVIRTDLADAASTEVRSPALTSAGGGKLALDPSDPQGKRLATPAFEVRVVVNNPDQKYLPGQRAYIRVRFDEDRTILWHMWRLLLQSIQRTKN